MVEAGGVRPLVSNTPRSSRACGDCEEASLQLLTLLALLRRVAAVARRDALVFFEQETSTFGFIRAQKGADLRQ